MPKEEKKKRSLRCCVCKKPLTDPNWVMLQLGPECAKKYRLNPSRFDKSITALKNNEEGSVRVRLTDKSLELAAIGKLASIDPYDSANGVEVQYLNERKSNVKNLGEDVAGAAKHRSLAWSSLEEAEKIGLAELVIKRDKLLKEMPIKGLKELTDQDFKKGLALGLALKRFPESPQKLTESHYGQWHINKAEDAFEAGKPYAIGPNAGARHSTDLDYKEKRLVRNGVSLNGDGLEWDDLTENMKGYTKEEYLKLRRSFYYSRYEKMKAFSEELINDNNEENIELDKFLQRISDKTREIATDEESKNFLLHTSPLVSWYNNVTRKGVRTSRGITMALRELGDSYGNHETLELIFKGKSLQAALGRGTKSTSAKKKGPSLADFYAKEAFREGPEITEKTREELENTLMKDIGIRGLQWGRSIPDKERMTHLKRFRESVGDFSSALGITEKQACLNGSVAFAIGARGKAGSMAHYESKLEVVSINRTGVGALAHEMFHAIDHYVGKKSGSKRLFTKIMKNWRVIDNMSEDEKLKLSQEEVAYAEVFKSLDPFMTRMRGSKSYRSLTAKKMHYFSSPVEVFARLGERMITKKLAEKGQSNTYLSGGHNEDFWPNEEELAAIGPSFDKLISLVFKKDVAKAT